MRDRGYEQHGRGVFAGLLFLALGLILLAGNLDFFPVRPTLSQWWPVVLIIIGIKHLIVFRSPTAWVGALFWFGTGALFLASTLGYLNVSLLSLLWPVVLIWFGVCIVTGCGDGSHRQVTNRSE
jgi:hypothetical protein